MFQAPSKMTGFLVPALSAAKKIKGMLDSLDQRVLKAASCARPSGHLSTQGEGLVGCISFCYHLSKLHLRPQRTTSILSLHLKASKFIYIFFSAPVFFISQICDLKTNVDILFVEDKLGIFSEGLSSLLVQHPALQIIRPCQIC